MNKVILATPVEYAGFRTDGDSEIAFSSSTMDTNFPLSNLFTTDPTAVVRSAGTTANFTVDLGRQREFDVISILNTNMDYRSLWTVEVSNDNSTWTTLVNNEPFWANLTTQPSVYTGGESGDPRRWANQRMMSWYLSDTIQYWRYVRITATNSVNWTFGRLFIGRSYVPATGMQYGSLIDFNETGTKDRTTKGALVTDPGRSLVTATLKLEFVSKQDMQTEMYSLAEWRGSTREVLVCLDANNIDYLHRNIIYGTMTEGRRISADSYNMYSQNLIIESA